jgi:hypothetical protein
MAPDLDLRPGEPARSTLPRWVATCSGCGAAAPDLSTLPEAARAVVSAETYPRAAPRHARAFLCHAAIRSALGDAPGAAMATLQAAWAADDAADADGALRWRLAAAELWATPDDLSHALAQVDAWRRAASFDRAEAACAVLEARGPDETTARVIAFQRARIGERDTSRHLMSSALRPPARTPHVTHGREGRRGLVARLFGRG